MSVFNLMYWYVMLPMVLLDGWFTKKAGTMIKKHKNCIETNSYILTFFWGRFMWSVRLTLT